ncbi:hypothetical protein GCM10025864_16850 [Luteimicrobium album]|uniref:Abi-like protein n=1 Tax=Luteimicrobium album TaxID=1054550 RepID=A0ABQ6I115_9MICO|nr:hypothetical protein [Luteimicrobium album]GMA23926.1 hypothetical protein GCM10025864_16850 [Luteimicrobium album]
MTSSGAILSATDAAVRSAVSTARLKPYLAETGSNTNDAIRLYQWNIELSAAAYELLHFFEVALRNAIDAQLCRWNAEQVRDGAGLGRDWLMDPASLLNRLAGKDIAEAKRRAGVAARRRTGPRKHAPVEHADVLANLSLGTWRYLLPDNDEGRQFLWRKRS